MHDDQHEISPDSVRSLIDEQFPQWAGLALTPIVSDGTVNALFRLGDELTVRVPLQGDDPAAVRQFLENEAAASAELADAVSVGAPRAVAIGEPGPGCPLPWAVQTWVDGTPLTAVDVADSVEFARDLAGLITQLRAVPVAGRRFSGRGRGGDLTSQDGWIETCLERSVDLLDVDVLRALWERFRALPSSAGLAMNHTDLMPGNVLAHDGRLVGVIDCGGFSAADRALDLVSAWHLLESEPREVLRRELGSSDLARADLDWQRGQAWAFAQAMGLVWYYQHSNPVMAAIGRRTLDRIVAEPTV